MFLLLVVGSYRSPPYGGGAGGRALWVVWGFVVFLVTLNNLTSSAIELYRAIEQYCYYGYHWIE